jgi:hypothetical protein
MPFTMMAQTRSSSYDEKLEQFYGRAPLSQELTRDAFNGGGDWSVAPNFGYGIVNGQFVKFDPANPTSDPSSAGMQFEGYDFVSAEIVAFNSTTDHIYAFASDGRFCLIDPQANEITVLGNGDPMTELAYDVTTKTMYGLRYGVLYTVNMEDGTSSPVNAMLTGSNNWVALAIDKEGKMYGITNTFSNVNAELYYISTTDWNSTKVGTLPYRTQYAQSMAFDRDNGTLYWWQASSGLADPEPVTNFLRVNPANAACTALWPNNGYEVSGMFFKYSPFTYPITYETVENGTFSGPAFAAENDVVEVTVTPDYGYRLGTLTWNGNEIDVEAGAPYTFTMIDEPVTVSGSFLLSLHNIIVLDPKDGTLATNPENEGFYLDIIQVLPTPDPGFGVASITYTANGESNTITAEPYEFIMPDYDVTVSAVYEQTGENTVFIGTDYYGYFDDIVTVSVEMDNENLVAGTQMDIALGQNLTFVPGSLTLSDRAEGEGWVIAGNVIGENVLRVNTYNNDLGYYAGNTGTIFTFQVQCARVVSNNTLAISGLIAGTPDATNLNMVDVDGALEIKDVVMNQPENVAYCHNAETAPIVFGTTIEETEGPITYAWTNDNTTIGLEAEGEGDIDAFTTVNTTDAAVVANLTVTPTLIHNGNPCVGSTLEFTITVNPQVVMETPENQVVCNGAETAEVVFGTTITDGEMTYAWTNDNAEIGLAAEGEGNIDAFTAVNEGNAAVTANIAVTPTYANNGLECVGEPVNFSITVNPTPVMVAVENQVVCNGAEVAAVEFATNVTDGEVTYAWTNDNAEIGLAAEGEGNIDAFTAVNEGTAAVVATIEVTPTYTNFGVSCVGEPIQFTITVNPTPVMVAVENQVVCNGAEVAAVEFATNITDGEVTYAWTNDNAEIGLAAEGEGNIDAFTAVNEGNATVMATIEVTPTYTNEGVSCVGEPIQFTITVNPTPVMVAVEDMVVCDNTEVNVNFATNITDGEVTYAWTNDNAEIGLAAEGEGNIEFLSANVNGEPLVANITVTPTYTNNGIECVGEPISFTITVYPTPVMNEVADQTIYSREYTEDIIFTSNVTTNKVIFNWVNDNPAIGLAAEGTGNILSFMGAAPITTTQVGHITVTPIYSDITTCEGASITFTITVEPTYLVVIAEGIENGTLTDDAHVAANGEHYAIPGEEITLTATPADGYVIENVTAYQLDNQYVNVPVENDETFIMPEFDVEANATFIDSDNLLIKPGTIDLGYRPINAWMFSKFFDATNISAEDFDITEMDLTDYTFFALDEVELPFTIEAGQTAQFGINTNYKNVTPGLKNTTLALLAQHSRKPYLRNVVANAYTPVEPDVWELATNVTTYPYVTTQATKDVLYDNYQLPGETPDGYDGVYKLVFDHDVILNAEITEGNDPKVVLYDNGFRQVGGPHIDNYHNAPLDMDNTALVGNGTTTTQYTPYYTYYKYSISQVIYRAEELAAAGLQPGKINSIEYTITNNTSYTRDNISIWMANVPTATVSSTSILTAGMPLVYTGSHVQVPEQNVFVFNGDQFVWDGTSNILVTFVMNHGAYNSSPYTYWAASNPGFAATSYNYRDSAPYEATTTTVSMTTSSTIRPDLKFNGVPMQSEGVPCDGSPIVDLGLFAGTYYLVASSTSEDNYTLEIDVDDIPLPLAPTAIYPAHEAQGIETPVTFQFELGEYTHEYQLLLGTEYNNQEVVVDWTSDLTGSFDAGELLHNTIYFWRINERNSTGVTEGPVWAFTTELNVPMNLALVEDELFEGDAAVLTWDQVADRTHIGYNIYQDGIKINDAPVMENTYSVNGLTYNMDGYVFNVTAAYTEGESEFSNDAVAYYSGYGTIGGHVFEQDGTTGIAGATVIVIGFDEFDELVDYEFTTNEAGVFAGLVHAGYYFGMASKEGYQSAADNYGIEVEYEDVINDYNFILNEEYVPVSRVVAEEIDPTNVHVFWGWDMIEDFESGDFNSYEWVNNGTYPWAITTNNPYEGTYCMKSTNEDMHSTTSAIEITVTNGNDGLMSFFYKISSESTFDKGIFYIDGVAKMTVTGSGSWIEKQLPISAGTHTLKWSYEKDSSVSSNDDCFYIDYINFFFEPEPLPEGMTFFDFENGGMQGWTTIDADGDGHDWGMISELYSGTTGHNNSNDGVASQSYASGALYPDNYLVSPQFELGGSITFWAAAYSTSFADEHFGVYVSTTGMNPSDFVSVQEWTTLATKDAPHGGDREKVERAGAWYQYTADLSAYEGQTGYVAIRHHDCSDEWAILVDDIDLQPRYRAFNSFNVYRQNTLTSAIVGIAEGVTETETNDLTWGSAAPGVYRWGVSAVYSGNRGESEITWSNTIDKDMFATVNVTVTTNSNDPATGAVVTLTNTGETEYVYTATLDETGIYSWDNVRKGNYNVSVELDGFTPVAATATVDGTTNLSYVLTEIISNVEDLYVSTTGWAMFGEMPAPTPVDPTPTEGQWYYYDNGTNEDAIGTGGGNFYWGVMFPAGSYTGNAVIKVSAYDYMAMTGDVTIYNDGAAAPSNPVGTTNVTFTGSSDFVEFEFDSPVIVDPTKNLWVVFYNASGATYPAAVCANTGDANGRWVSIDGVEWMDLASAGLSNTFMVRAYIAGAKGEVTEIAYTPKPCDGGILSNAGVAKATRSIEYYNVKLNGVMEGTTTLPFFQHNVEGLAEGSTNTTSVQKVYTTGESEWVDFTWVYTSCDNYAGLVSDPTAEWQGQDVVLSWVLPGGDGPTPPPVEGDDNFSFDFEGGMQGWTTIDADGNGLNWYHSSNSTAQSGYDYTGLGHNGSNGFIISQSFIDYDGAYEADNYVITPEMYAITSGSTLTFWADYANDSYPDNFGVYVATAANPTANDFTMVWEGTAKDSNVEKLAARHDNNRYENWRQHTVNLGAYAGQVVWIAFRHTDYDMYEIWIDDVTLTPSKSTRSFDYDFEGSLQGWTTIDADGNGLNWYHSSNSTSQSGYDYTGLGHNGSNGFAISQSFIDYDGAYEADNYLVSPQMFALQNGSNMTFWADYANDSYPDHFGVYVATTANPTANDFTAVWEGTAKTNGNKAAVRHDNNRYENWRQHTVDLSAYAGQTVWIAFRHNDYDMYEIWIDDVTINAEGGTTPVDPVDPTPADNIIGVEIFRNGEWLAEVHAPAQTYTDAAVEGATEYEIRVVYDGLTEDYTYYAMSCPQMVAVEDNPCAVTPDNLTGTYEYVSGTEFGALINWTYGTGAEWFYYDNGTPATSVGEGDAHLPLYWGIMVPTTALNGYNGFALTRVAFFETDAVGTATINIYQGGSNAPGTLIHTQDVDYTGLLDWHYVDLTANVPVDVNQNLWITMYNNGDIEYPATCSANTGDPNGRWISEDGTNWMDVATAGLSYTWMVRGFVTNAVEAAEAVALAPFNGGGTTTMNFSAVELNVNATEFNNTKNTREPVSFNVYRNGAVVGNVPYTGEYRYSYFDNVAAGNYEYQVTAVYDACESDFALTPDLSQNYVDVTVTSVSETVDSRIYPNPTTGNVTIEANNMKHITVISTLGQVLYDANISGDTYTMNLGQYQAGLYMVRIFTENGVSVKRVTVVK